MGIIRIYLALIVVYGHLQFVITEPIGLNVNNRLTFGMNAGYAVMYFFIISGFLISYALESKYKDRIFTFYKNRFIRIFSLYWPVCLIDFMLYPGCMYGKTLLMRFLSVIIVGSDWMVTLAKPQGTVYPFPAFMNVSWSLGAELAFYIIAPFLLPSFRACVALFAFSLASRLSLQYVNGFSPWIYTFFISTVMFFLLGHFMNVFGRWLRFPAWAVFTLLAMSAFCAIQSAGAWGFCFYAAFMLFAICLPSVFEATKNCRWMNIIGEISYPVYLIHFIILCSIPAGVVVAVIGWLRKSPLEGFTSEVFCAGILSGICMVALVVHYVIERPVATVMHRSVELGGRLMEPLMRRLGLTGGTNA